MIDKHLNRYENQVLDKRSLYLRKLVIRAFEGGSRGHLGSSMSLIEILRVLYDSFLNYKVKMPEWEDRDRFILSKGHGCLAQYALLADKGFIKLTDLDFFCHLDGILGGHPEHSKIPGIEASTGALGHGLSIGVGMAVSAKIKHKRHKIIVVTGDGEINEGSIWEAAMSASQNKLDNLIWIIDYNKLQSYGETREIINLEPLNDKISSFGFNVSETDGHNTKMIEEALTNTNLDNGNPSAIICHTVKGKGFPFAEHNPDWHHKAKLGIDVIQKMKECLND